MKSLLLSSVALTLVLSGCVLTPRNGDPVDIVKNAKLINDAAREGSFVAITKIYDDDVEKRIEAALDLQAVTTRVLAVLNDPTSEITHILEEELLKQVPEEYHGLLATAYETLYTYYEAPAVGELLPEPYLTYLRAFFVGLDDGAKKVVEFNTEG